MSNMNKNEKTTIQMMKLFQENVKKDISNTNSVIKLVQEKLKDCDLNLNSLKQIAKELNIDFANIENKVNNLDSLKRSTNSESTSSLSRNSSLSSLTDHLNEHKLNEELVIKVGNELEDLENTYIYVTVNQDGEPMDEINWAKRSSMSSNSDASSTSSYQTDENSNDSDYGNFRTTNNDNDVKMNESLIRMLLQSSSSQQIDH